MTDNHDAIKAPKWDELPKLLHEDAALRHIDKIHEARRVMERSIISFMDLAEGANLSPRGMFKPHREMFAAADRICQAAQDQYGVRINDITAAVLTELPPVPIADHLSEDERDD